MILRKLVGRTGRFAALTMVLFTLAVSAYADEQRGGEPCQPDGASGAENADVGVAAYYARRYEGRRTTSGARYRHNKMTAAHPTLPLGSHVRVTNLANGRSVEVKVTDRCRRRSFPFIDLSRGAAAKLGFLGKGSAKVRIVPL